MNVFKRLLTISFCLLCLIHIGTLTEAATITINELDNSWRPRADVDFPTEEERSRHNVYATVTINIYNAQTSSTGQKPTVTVSLSEVTNWKGICGNVRDPDASLFPNDPPNPDLVLERTDSHNSDWTKVLDENENTDFTQLTYTLNNESQISVKVSCKDYGAYGKITATLTDYAGAGDKKSTKSNTVTIPRDSNKNKIADVWESEVTLTPAEKAENGASLDEETGPAATTVTDASNTSHNIAANTNDGDGLSIFAEYRGFKLYDGLNCRWQYTNPREKDIFVTWEWALQSYKAGYASEMPAPMKVNLVPESYVKNPGGDLDSDESRWVNFNNEGLPGHKRVYAIKVGPSDATPSTTVNGTPYPVYGTANSAPKPPNKGSVIVIYTNNIQIVYPNAINSATNNVIAHEVAHCTNLNHCPVNPCPYAGESGDFCYMDRTRDRSSNAIFGVAHNPYYDAHPPHGNIQPVANSQVGDDSGAPSTSSSNGGTIRKSVMSSGNTISTNTGASHYGCDHNSEHDWCTDTGNCGSPTDSSTNGLCGHRWCICAAAPSEDTSTTDTTTSTDNSPDCDSCTTGGCSACPINYACHASTGHSGDPSQSSAHQLIPKNTLDGYCTWHSFYACSKSKHVAKTGDCGHSFYKCQERTGNHYKLRCWHRKRNGDRCKFRYWKCQYLNQVPEHTHRF